MKTAVLVCGLPREIGETWETLRDNVVRSMPGVDVFIHTGEPYPFHPSHPFWWECNVADYRVERQFRHHHVEKIVLDAGFYAPHNIDALVQQFYGLRQAWAMMKFYTIMNHRHRKYDLVVRTRSDLIYLRPLTVDLIDPAGFNTLHAHFAPTMATEFAVGPPSVMAVYCSIYDWLVLHGMDQLTSSNPRLDHPEKAGAGRLYNCDVLMTTYLIDQMGVERAPQRLPPESPSPYDYHRIYSRHVKDLYR